MGAVGGLLGLGGGAGGSGFNPQSATDPGRLAYSYQQAKEAAGQGNQLLDALKAQGGLGKQTDVYGQLQNIVSGQGPNPAQAMLAQATGQNVANQAALAAGQRGAGANAGLLARQAGMQGMNAQQQAAGQGATMQANQALGALGQAGGLANTLAQQQIGQTQQNTANQLAMMGQQNQAQMANAQIQGKLAEQQMAGGQKMLGGGLNALTGGLAGMAAGGQVPGSNAPQSMFGQSLQTFASGGNVGSQLKAGGHVPGEAKVSGDSYKNDTVKALLSPGEVVIPRSVMQSKDPARGAAQFVQAVMAKKKVK